MNYQMEFENKTFRLDARKVLIAVICCIVAASYTFLKGSLPEVYIFATDPQSTWLTRILEAPVHLADDTMISLRAGYILRETGVPAFNRGDLAEPSTSYAAPYLFSFLLTIFPENISVIVYAMLGIAAVQITFALIVLCSRSTANAILLVALLSLTSTNLLYSVGGWDHLFQGLFLVLATCLAYRPPTTPIKLLAISTALAFGSLFRPDGPVISVAILVALYTSRRNIKQVLIFGATPFVGLLTTVLALNFAQFNSLTPTTARLKIGSSPSLEYAIRYVIENSLLSYTALTVLIVLVVFYITFHRIFPGLKVFSITVGCVLTAALATYNSDVFAGARMFWSPACVMATLIAVTAPSLFHFNKAAASQFVEIDPIYRNSLPKFWLLFGASKDGRGLAMLLFILLIGVNIYFAFVETSRRALVSYSSINTSPAAEQFIIAKWIDRNLSPDDGPIGFFYLGVSYFLPRFEIADFLGKADEVIATSQVKWGPPGHNKWDIDKSLRKWKPQAIVPSSRADPNLAGAREFALKALKEKRDFGFSPALLVNGNVSNDFLYCYVPDPHEGVSDKWGFFLRKDIAARHSDQLRCSLQKKSDG